MSDRTQEIKNLRAVATACKNYVDNKIDDLKYELGTYDLDVESDTTSAYQKNVPANSIKAKINTLGGMSYKTTNLVQNNTATTQYVDTDQFLAELLPSSTYTISFVSSASGSFTLRSVYSAIDLLYSQSVSVGLNSYTFTTPSNYTNTGNYLYFYATSDVVGTELRINSGSTALPYEPYYSGIRDTAITNVKSVGANVLPPNLNPNYKKDGSLFPSGNVNTDGVITVNINASYYEGSGFLLDDYLKPNTTYTFKCVCSNTSVMYYNIYNNNDNVNVISDTNTFTFTTPSVLNNFIIGFSATIVGVTLSNLMINEGSSAIDYKPYFSDTLTIDSNIQTLDGYGMSDNYIDFNDKKFKKQRIKIVLNGTENWTYQPNYPRFYIELPTQAIVDDDTINCICDKLSETTVNTTMVSGDNEIAVGGNYLFIRKTDLTSETDLENWLSSNNIVVEYLIATPVETDISAYLTTNKITVEGNGTLTMENTYGASVPSDIDYLIEEVKA